MLMKLAEYWARAMKLGSVALLAVWVAILSSEWLAEQTAAVGELLEYLGISVGETLILAAAFAVLIYVSSLQAKRGPRERMR